jgi:hypothetical protein
MFREEACDEAEVENEDVLNVEPVFGCESIDGEGLPNRQKTQGRAVVMLELRCSESRYQQSFFL